jgi:antitoxin HigA-1
MTSRKHNPIHPGEVLAEDFLGPLGVTNYRLGKDIGISHQHVGRIVTGSRGITADIALRLARYFGTSPEFWMNLQARFDLETTLDREGAAIAKRITPRAEKPAKTQLGKPQLTKSKRGRAA